MKMVIWGLHLRGAPGLCRWRCPERSPGRGLSLRSPGRQAAGGVAPCMRRPGRGRDFAAGLGDARRRKGREIPHCNACVLFRRRGGLALPGWGEGPRQPMLGRLCGLPKGPPSWCEAACPHLQPFHSTPSPRTPLEFSRWKFTSEALWPRILSLVPPTPEPQQSYGLQDRGSPGTLGPPPRRAAAREGDRPPGDPHVLLPTPQQLQTHLRFISLCCLLCGVQASQPTWSWTG